MADTYLLLLPLVSSLFWVTAAVVLGNRTPFNTFSGRFFVGFCLALGAYALFDWLAFMSVYEEQALLAMRMADVSLTFAPAMIFMFAKGMARSRTWKDLMVLAPTLVMAALVADPMLTGATAAPWGFLPLMRLDIYYAWVAWLVALSLTAWFYMIRNEVVLRPSWGSRTTPLRVFYASLLSIVAVGLGTNFLGQAIQQPFPRLLSSFLFVPAVILLALFLRESRESFMRVMASFQGRPYSILHGLLVYRGGKLLASTSSGARLGIDQDLMTGMLDAIQSFVKHSFPYADDGTLKAIEQADVRLIVENGRFCYLVLVIRGTEDEFLRSLMADLLRRFEIENFDFLTDWTGDATDVPDCDPLFRAFFPSAASS